MHDIQFVSAAEVLPTRRAQLITQAYADYYVPMRLTAEQMGAMDRLYDIDLQRSVVAQSGAGVVGMALLAVRGDQGWITGVGVLPAFRRRGLGGALITRLIAAAAQIGLRQIMLEVIVENEPARRLYTAVGFKETRELLIWRRRADADALPIPEERLVQAPADVLLSYFDGWHSQPLTWQRSAATLALMETAGRLKGYRLDWHGAPAAYCLISGQRESISLMDIGIDPLTGIMAPGRILLQALSHLYWGQALTISNVPADDPLNRVLAALRFLVTTRQVEMRLDLTGAI